MSQPFEDWSHRKFAEDLAQAKNNTLVEVPLGGVYRNNMKLPRADVVEIKPSYSNFYVTIYEIKQRRSDILKSIRKGKWKKYLPHCHRFYFAARRGIIEQGEVPEGVGLALRNENGWYSVRAGTFRKDHQIPRETLLAYLFQRVKFMNKLDRREKIASHYRYNKELKNVGDEVSEALHFHRQFGWALNRALENGISRWRINQILTESASLEDMVIEAMEFKNKYGDWIEKFEEQTDSSYTVKFAFRKVLKELKELTNPK